MKPFSESERFFLVSKYPKSKSYNIKLTKTNVIINLIYSVLQKNSTTFVLINK
jgi:hypothetical protein